MTTRTYTELLNFVGIEDRFEYLSLYGKVGDETFGFERFLNQGFYNSPEWRRVRREVIIRDNACDLGVKGYDIYDKVVIHHMNPIRKTDIFTRNPDILNPEFLITVSHSTHNAIHYGTDKLLPRRVVERKPGDTKLW